MIVLDASAWLTGSFRHPRARASRSEFIPVTKPYTRLTSLNAAYIVLHRQKNCDGVARYEAGARDEHIE
jgi:hypothetical protein